MYDLLKRLLRRLWREEWGYSGKGVWVGLGTAIAVAGGGLVYQQVTTSGGPDTQAPSVPPDLVTTSVTQTQVSLLWGDSTDNVGVVNYRVYRTGTFLGEGPGTSGGFTNTWVDAGRTCNTLYTYAVESQDAAGNTSGQATLPVTTSGCSGETTPPTVSLTAPANGANVSGTITVSATASDNVGVTQVEFLRAGTAFASDPSSPYSVSFDTTGVANGSHTFAARASDAAGNQATSAGATVTVTNGAQPANVWMATNGNDSTCTRGNQSLPCLTMNRAYEVAQCGDTVQMAAGNYGDQNFGTGNKNCPSTYVKFTPASGATVTTAQISATGNAEWMEFNGFNVNRMRFYDSMTDNLRFINMNGGSFDMDSKNVYMTGNDWGPCESNGAVNCGGQNFLQARSENVIIDGDTFHDYIITPNSGAHFECMYVTGAAGTGIMIRNSWFYNCWTYAMYFTGFHPLHQYTGSITIENNWFGRTCCFTGSDRTSAINLGSGAPASTVNNILLRFNSFADGQQLVREGGPSGTNNRAIGNIFGTSGCVADFTYSYNAIKGGTCGTGDVNIASMPYVNGNIEGSANYHLSGADGSTAADNLVPANANSTLTTDRDGQARPNDALRDAGSDER